MQQCLIKRKISHNFHIHNSMYFSICMNREAGSNGKFKPNPVVLAQRKTTVNFENLASPIY